jgi:hypothetical protein
MPLRVGVRVCHTTRLDVGHTGGGGGLEVLPTDPTRWTCCSSVRYTRDESSRGAHGLCGGGVVAGACACRLEWVCVCVIPLGWTWATQVEGGPSGVCACRL